MFAEFFAKVDQGAGGAEAGSFAVVGDVDTELAAVLKVGHDHICGVADAHGNIGEVILFEVLDYVLGDGLSAQGEQGFWYYVGVGVETCSFSTGHNDGFTGGVIVGVRH